jgi:hypothetical protein
MAIVSLSRSLGTRFLERISAIAGQGKSTAGNPLAALGGQDAAITPTSLKGGAQIMVNSIDLLAAGFQAVDGSRSALIRIGESLDELIQLAETSADPQTGGEERERVAFEFQRKGNELKQLVDSAKDNKTNVLTQKGLVEILTNISLKPDDLDGLSTILDSFQITTTDGDFFDPTIKAERPLDIPRNLPSSTEAEEYGSVLDGATAIGSRRGAYNMLADLKAVKANLDANTEAMTAVTNYLSDARTLVRTIGLTLLDLTSLAEGGASADELALSLQSRVRADARGALDQLESLGPLVSRAGTLLATG